MEQIIGDQMRGQTILEQTRMGVLPQGWRVLTANGRYFIGQGALMSAGVLIFLTVGGMMIAASTGAGGTQDAGSWALLPFGIVFVLASIFVTVEAVFTIRQITQADAQKLVFMPDGVVQVGVGTLFKRTDRVIFYNQVTAMFTTTHVISARTGQETVSVNVTTLDGTRIEWPIDDRFGANNQTGAMLTAAFAQYELQHAMR